MLLDESDEKGGNKEIWEEENLGSVAMDPDSIEDDAESEEEDLDSEENEEEDEEDLNEGKVNSAVEIIFDDPDQIPKPWRN
ncbi:hypothetical protein U1Q18_039954 [Sarracenia purpurea var. burkii]